MPPAACCTRKSRSSIRSSNQPSNTPNRPSVLSSECWRPSAIAAWAKASAGCRRQRRLADGEKLDRLVDSLQFVIAAAGGFRDFAKQKSVYVLRHNPNGTESRLPFNYKDVVKGKNPDQNIKLQPNDTIVIP